MAIGRRWRRIGVAAAAFAPVVLITALSWPVPLEKRVARIQPGMTRAEVATAVGQPPGNYCERVRWETTVWVSNMSDPRPMQWEWDDGLLIVWFSRDDDTASEISFTLNRGAPRPPSLWDRLRRQLPW